MVDTPATLDGLDDTAVDGASETADVVDEGAVVVAGADAVDGAALLGVADVGAAVLLAEAVVGAGALDVGAAVGVLADADAEDAELTLVADCVVVSDAEVGLELAPVLRLGAACLLG